MRCKRWWAPSEDWAKSVDTYPLSCFLTQRGHCVAQGEFIFAAYALYCMWLLKDGNWTALELEDRMGELCQHAA